MDDDKYLATGVTGEGKTLTRLVRETRQTKLLSRRVDSKLRIDTAGQEGRLDTILPTLARKDAVQGDPALNWQRKEEDGDAVPFDCRGEVASQSDLLS